MHNQTNTPLTAHGHEIGQNNTLALNDGASNALALSGSCVDASTLSARALLSPILSQQVIRMY